MTAALVTASELAALRIPGYPTTKQGWNLLREKRGFAVATRRGPRGAELLVVSDLPEDARAAIAAHRAAALLPPSRPKPEPVARRGRPAGSGHFDRHPDQATAVLSWIAVHKHGAPNIHRLLIAEFGNAAPHLKTVRRHIQALEQTMPATLMRERDPDAAKNRYQLAIGRADGGVSYAHEVWELDTTKADVMTKGGRRMVLGCIDRWSRRVRFMVADSESGLSVRRLLIDTMLAWGVTPTTVVTDNGSGYVNVSVTTALDLLDIAHEPCLPGAPERKPFVERMFQTFMHHRAPLLPGFTGRSVAEAQALRGRAKKRTGRATIVAEITPDELQAELDLWVDGRYHLDVHSGIGMSPLARWTSSPLPARAAPDPEQLRLALSALIGTRRVGKKGLEWKGGSYWCAALAVWMGRDVVVRRDEDNLGELLVFDHDGHFIGTAVNFERAGWSEREFAIAARNHMRQHENQARKMVRDAQREFPIDRAIAAMRRDEAERAGKVIAFPSRTATAPSLVHLDLPAQPVVPSEEELARAERSVRAMPAAAVPAEEEIAAKVARADRLLSSAEGATDDELRWARAYAASAEYRTEKMLAADFGAGRSNSLATFNQEKFA